MPTTDKKPAADAVDMLAVLSDQMVKNSMTKIHVESLIDQAIEDGDLVATAKNDIMLQLGRTALRDGDKVITGEDYTTKDGILRPAGQPIALAIKEWIEARPHVNGRKPEPTDMEATAFDKSSPKRLWARGELVKQMGVAGANERAIEWGLKSIHDYASEATKPDPNGTDKNKGKVVKIREARTVNPWLYQDARPEEFAEFIRTKGTAAALAASEKANRTLSGQPRLEKGTFRRVV